MNLATFEIYFFNHPNMKVELFSHSILTNACWVNASDGKND
jgi:hypothetical protein